MSKKEKFYILDWAGNIKFHGEKFNSFDEAWETIIIYLESVGKDDSWLEEYQVLPCSKVKTL